MAWLCLFMYITNPVNSFTALSLQSIELFVCAVLYIVYYAVIVTHVSNSSTAQVADTVASRMKLAQL